MTQYLIPTEPPRPGLRDNEARVLAVIRADLAEAVGLPDRTVRRIAKALIEVHGFPICSSYEADRGGYYWPATQEEIDRVRRRLRGHALSILVRESRLGRSSRRMRHVREQLRLEVAR